MRSNAAVGTSPRWTEALTSVGLEDGAAAPSPDLALLFASPEYAELEALVANAYRRTAASVLIGCTGGGVIGPDREIEDEHAISLLNLDLPGVHLHPRHVVNEDLSGLRSPADWHAWLGLAPDRVNAWILLADPFTFDSEALIQGLSAAYPGKTIAGGLATGPSRGRETKLFLNSDVYESGAVLLAVGGAYTVQSIVAQGAAPIGQPWTITGVQRNILRTIGNRPAFEVLRETLNGLDDDMRERAARNLLVGLAMDEYRESFQQGDFLIRNLVGADPESGALAIGALPEVGQTIQFQVRDAEAADQDLKRQLASAKERFDTTEVAGALLCTCNGRGVGLFGSADHDARAISAALGPLALAGFFCNGEIGPVGARTYLHGFTASLALFVPTSGT
jgi:small ligand-binding sensory domain FIST